MTKDVTKLDVNELIKLIEEEKRKLLSITEDESNFDKTLKPALSDHHKIGLIHENIGHQKTMTSFEELKEMLLKKAGITAEIEAEKEWAEIQTKQKIRDLVNHLGGLKETITLFHKALDIKSAGRKKRTTLTPEMLKRMERYFDEGRTSAYIAKALGVSLPTIAIRKRMMGKTNPKPRETAGSR